MNTNVGVGLEVGHVKVSTRRSLHLRRLLVFRNPHSAATGWPATSSPAGPALLDGSGPLLGGGAAVVEAVNVAGVGIHFPASSLSFCCSLQSKLGIESSELRRRFCVSYTIESEQERAGAFEDIKVFVQTTCRIFCTFFKFSNFFLFFSFTSEMLSKLSSFSPNLPLSYVIELKQKL